MACPDDPARQAAAPDARLARWFAIGSATVATASLATVAVFVWLALELSVRACLRADGIPAL